MTRTHRISHAPRWLRYHLRPGQCQGYTATAESQAQIIMCCDVYYSAEFYDNNILLHAHNTCRGDLVPRRWRLYVFYSFISFHFDRSKAPRVTTRRDVERDDDRHEAINRCGRRRETGTTVSPSPQLYVIAVVLITSLFLEHYIDTSTHCTLRRTITIRKAKIAVFLQKRTQKIHCTRVSCRLLTR